MLHFKNCSYALKLYLHTRPIYSIYEGLYKYDTYMLPIQEKVDTIVL